MTSLVLLVSMRHRTRFLPKIFCWAGRPGSTASVRRPSGVTVWWRRRVVSGFVLLFEGGIAVGHILEVEGEIVRVKRIDLRSTRVETVSGEWIVLPNSKVSGEAVVNLSQGGTAVRISVDVGVAYGSDVEQVTALLKEAVMEQPETNDKPPVAVFFRNFGESSLDFTVTGWIDDPWNRMAIQSRIRTAIDAKFRAHGVTIPFPQRYVHLSSGNPEA